MTYFKYLHSWNKCWKRKTINLILFINRLSPLLYKMKDKALKAKVSCNEQNTEKHISGMKSYGLCFLGCLE